MTGKKGAKRQTKKRPYRAPELTVHGNLKAITKVKGGGSTDGGGKPTTRWWGGNS